MQAWSVDRLEGIAALALVAAPPAAAPAAGEATVAMSAVGLNYPDLLMLSGGYQFRPVLPFIPGGEGCGRVVAVGEGLSADLLGMRMMVRGRTGLLADAITVPVGALRIAPDALSDAEAAAFTTGALTAWVGLVVRGRIAAGEHLLVLGAGGGMGLAAVALGKALGAEVTAATSTPEKCAAAVSAGADHCLVIDRRAPDFARVAAACDLVFDPVGGAAVLPALQALRRGGRYLVIGFVGGRAVGIPSDLVRENGIEVVGVRAGEAGRHDPAGGRAWLAAIDRLAEQGQMRPLIGLSVPMAQAPAAFQAMQDGTLVGKAVVTLAPA